MIYTLLFSSHQELNGRTTQGHLYDCALCKFFALELWNEKSPPPTCFEESVAISLFHYLSRKKKTEHFKTIKVTALNTLPNHDLRSAIRPYIREGEKKTNGEITGSGPPVEIMVRGVILARNLGKTSHIHTAVHPSPQEKIRL